MKKLLEKYKYPIIILAVGIVLLLLPSSSGNTVASLNEDLLLQQVLACSEGVGSTMLVSSESGVVISCEGAGNAKVRLDIIQAVSSYTGFSSDKITILKMVK